MADDPSNDGRAKRRGLFARQGADDDEPTVSAPPLTTARLTGGPSIGSVDLLVESFNADDSTRQPDNIVSIDSDDEDNAPVVQVVKHVLLQAKHDRASDVHFVTTPTDMRVRFRIDGSLKDVQRIPASMGVGVISRIKIMANMNIVERRRPQDGQFATIIGDAELDVRVATVASINGENCVLRILDKSRSVFDLAQLGMPPETYATYSKLVRSPFGMVICAGPTGSGKTTTLYATLSEIVENSINVMTIEDPVEYVFPDIVQLQTNEQAGLDFATGLRSILRQDPDVILVGEIRDQETTRVAVQSAMTGHFVASSIHATDTVSALHRVLDMGIEAFLVASSVIGVVGQRLLRRTCAHCRKPYQPGEEEMAFYTDAGGSEKSVFYRGEGCDECAGTGFQGRIGVYELLVVSPEIRRSIVGWATQEEVRNLAVKQGMRTMLQEAVGLIENDTTTIHEVIKSIYSG